MQLLFSHLCRKYKMIQSLWETFAQVLSNEVRRSPTQYPGNSTTRYLPKRKENICLQKRHAQECT